MRAAVLALLAAVALASAARAEPTFATGSRVGLEPPPGMAVSKRFTGFENAAKGAVITIAEMPAEAYPQISAGMTDQALGRQGFVVKSRETLKIGDRPGFLIAGEQALSGRAAAKKWVLGLSDPTVTVLVVAQAPEGNDAGVAAALKTIALRPPLPMKDQIAALPFKLGDLAGFRPVRTLAGATVILTDGPSDSAKGSDQPLAVIARSLAGAPPPGEAREQFARTALASQQTFKDVAIERSQSFRQNGQDWHEIVARAVDGPSGQPIVVMQTIRFGAGDYLRMVGVVRADQRDAVLPRFRKLVDSIPAD